MAKSPNTPGFDSIETYDEPAFDRQDDPTYETSGVAPKSMTGKVGDAAKAAAQKVGDGAKVAAAKVGDGAKATGDFVKNNPVKTAAAIGGVAIAAGAAVAGAKLYKKQQAEKSAATSVDKGSTSKAVAPKIDPQAE